MKHIYYQQFESKFDADIAAECVIERISSKLRAVVVSEDPEGALTAFKKAWKSKITALLAERDHEKDVAYMGALTEIITFAQQASFAFSESNNGQTIIFAHPYEIHGDVWDDRQILICGDEESTLSCLQLLSLVNSEFRTLLLFGSTSEFIDNKITKKGLQKISDATMDLRKLLKEQVALCQEMGIKMNSVADDMSSDPEQARALNQVKTHKKYKQFVAGQEELAALRVVCGRAKAHKALSDRKLHALKVTTARLTSPMSSDWQLFDDPYDQAWHRAHGGRVTSLSAYKT